MPESQRALSPVTEGREGQGLGHSVHTNEQGARPYTETYARAHANSKHTMGE